MYGKNPLILNLNKYNNIYFFINMVDIIRIPNISRYTQEIINDELILTPKKICIEEEDLNKLCLKSSKINERKVKNNENITSIIRFILNNTERTWSDNMKILIKATYNKGDTFTLKDIYRKFEHILQLKYPLNYTIKASIRANLQVLRGKNIISFIDNVGNYILID
tara:strand:- start:23 stop:520 length:498 start_codon:yes stop_codon:yes gene_type:complete